MRASPPATIDWLKDSLIVSTGESWRSFFFLFLLLMSEYGKPKCVLPPRDRATFRDGSGQISRKWGLGGVESGPLQKGRGEGDRSGGAKRKFISGPFREMESLGEHPHFFGPGFLLKEKSDHAQNCDCFPYERICWPKAANSVFLSTHAPIVNVSDIPFPVWRWEVIKERRMLLRSIVWSLIRATSGKRKRAISAFGLSTTLAPCDLVPREKGFAPLF